MRKAWQIWVDQSKKQAARQGRHRINMLHKNIRHCSGHHIPDHSSAYSCEDAYEDDQKTVITVSCVDRRTAADHRKDPKADRIADQHDPVIPDCKAARKRAAAGYRQ